ncbi:MAG: tannase/feruloyl esterase family alpha/beta hydrolase [Pigmentiphaga sp.]|uniref:tannase/feruloyl esterase family alpha/beta hydrolase n=1 Tax=Pigmentiphaga sp. TaxID=1977564 RepID=UPI0029AF9DBC|nr:tannase/feruloyl esterase family alpha/beta hydrolase [Pigmentiphaga sp.]MDX3906336.1 tannase/feruloyl esterase family alpha/beta hydrolase [Pigmentiphaga sp.]
MKTPFSPRMTALTASILCAFLATGCGDGDDDGPGSPPPLSIACADLPARFASSQTERVEIGSAAEVPAQDGRPAYCDVRGSIKGNIKFAVYLPRDWNGRFQMVGNGGKAGSISLSDMETAMKAGYASASTDTGHDASVPAQSGARFGFDQEFGDEMEIDFGYRSVHLTAVVAKELIQAHYGTDIAYSYWNGCSTGGRQGLMEAQRYPDDFDGYLVGAPVYDYTRQQLSAPAILQNLYKNGIRGPSELPYGKLKLLNDIVYQGNGGDFAGCDAIDGLKDGIITNPLACTFDPAQHLPRCAEADGETCFTPTELSAIEAVYAGRPDVNVLPLPPGSEFTEGGWGTWFIASGAGVPQLHTVMADAFQYLLFEPDRPEFDYLRDLDWSREPLLMDKAKSIYNATDPDLRKFAESGKKMIMYHGWGDPGVNPRGTIEYRKNVETVFGDAGKVDEFYKLYMVPALGHCRGGQGHNTIDWMSALSAWVEEGKAPEGIVGTRPSDGSTRPQCPYPLEAVYDGAGKPEEASSFSCRQVAGEAALRVD